MYTERKSKIFTSLLRHCISHQKPFFLAMVIGRIVYVCLHHTTHISFAYYLCGWREDIISFSLFSALCKGHTSHTKHNHHILKFCLLVQRKGGKCFLLLCVNDIYSSSSLHYHHKTFLLTISQKSQFRGKYRIEKEGSNRSSLYAILNESTPELPSTSTKIIQLTDWKSSELLFADLELAASLKA